MNQNEVEKGPADFNRREFIKGASFGTLMMMMGGVPLQAEDKASATGDKDTTYNTIGAPVSCAVIGCGFWGREILQTLAVLPNAPVAAICDTYGPFLRRAKESAPKAEAFEDYRQLLAQKSVQAVIVATPTHQHKEIVLAALQAGKHVYCEAPLAITVEDARDCAGSQGRGETKFSSRTPGPIRPATPFSPAIHPQRRIGEQRHGPFTMAQEGKLAALLAESGAGERYQLAVAPGDFGRAHGRNWCASTRPDQLVPQRGPVAVSGWGGILNWNDGRDVADTIQSIFEYPEKVNYMYDCTLANSFDADYDMIYGTYAAVMMRGNKAWMFKESDSPLLGWEVYARKDLFYQETGIALVANATKLVALQEKPKTEEDHYKESPLNSALAAFVKNCDMISTEVTNFTATYGTDAEGLVEDVAELYKKRKSEAGTAAAGYKEGFEATVAALKANEAVVQGQKIVLKKEWFEI